MWSTSVKKGTAISLRVVTDDLSMCLKQKFDLLQCSLYVAWHPVLILRSAKSATAVNQLWGQEIPHRPLYQQDKLFV